LPLTTIGLTQYLTPIMQFLIGIYLLHEPLPIPRLIGFCLVWISLILYTVDMFRAARSARRSAPVSAG